jgi:toxin-antitoxin system PIN domain toxin
MNSRKFLLDVNVLVALSDQEHRHHPAARKWFNSIHDAEWSICPLTEAGFVRVSTNPRICGPLVRTFAQATGILASMAAIPGYCYLPLKESWVHLTTGFVDRISGHQQVTDAYLLGLAIKENGVLVTFDRGLRYMAGPEFARHVLVLE